MKKIAIKIPKIKISNLFETKIYSEIYLETEEYRKTA